MTRYFPSERSSRGPCNVFLAYATCSACVAGFPAIGQSLLLALTSRSRTVMVIWSTVAVSLLFSIVLFSDAYDWGRGLYIHFACLTLCLLYADSQPSAHPEVLPESGISGVLGRRVIAGVSLLLSASVWPLRNDVKSTALFGYAGKAYAATQFLSKQAPALGVR